LHSARLSAISSCARNGGAVISLCIWPLSVHADGWSEFHARCLSALEALVSPVVAGLGDGEATNGVRRYALPDGLHLLVEMTPPDGLSACSVNDPTGQAEVGFDTWIAEAVAAGRYILAKPGTWLSNQWTEPVLAVEKHRADVGVTLRIVETRHEA